MIVILSLALIVVLVILYCVVKYSREVIAQHETTIERNKKIFNEALDSANKMHGWDLAKLQYDNSNHLDEIEKNKKYIKTLESELAIADADVIKLQKKPNGIKTIKVFKTLPLEVGKTYMTKLATRTKFTVTKIELNKQGIQDRISGIHEKSPQLGSCPWYAERLIHEVEEAGTKDVCACCEFPINEKYVGKKSNV